MRKRCRPNINKDERPETNKSSETSQKPRSANRIAPFDATVNKQMNNKSSQLSKSSTVRLKMKSTSRRFTSQFWSVSHIYSWRSLVTNRPVGEWSRDSPVQLSSLWMTEIWLSAINLVNKHVRAVRRSRRCPIITPDVCHSSHRMMISSSKA